MILYLDTSALVKVYIEEPGSDRVANWLEKADEAAISVVAYAEVYSAFRRAFWAERRITESDFKAVVHKFEEDWRDGAYTLVGIGNRVLEKARDLILRYGLKGFDGIHLGAALFLNEQLGEVVFGAFDKKLLDVAEKESLIIA